MSISFREYFERGCLCVLTHRIDKFNGEDNELAVKYYEKNCTCSRHPESGERDCWDKDKHNELNVILSFLAEHGHKNKFNAECNDLSPEEHNDILCTYALKTIKDLHEDKVITNKQRIYAESFVFGNNGQFSFENFLGLSDKDGD